MRIDYLFYNLKMKLIELLFLIDGKPFFEIPIKNKEEACEQIIEMSKNY